MFGWLNLASELSGCGAVKPVVLLSPGRVIRLVGRKVVFLDFCSSFCGNWKSLPKRLSSAGLEFAFCVGDWFRLKGTNLGFSVLVDKFALGSTSANFGNYTSANYPR